MLGFGEPHDISNAAIFLLSDASPWVTGTSMVVDGGYTAK
jgi:NAD(P)-dependent dehydrogenase (short-subunit alcohol dehydrogenase family)